MKRQIPLSGYYSLILMIYIIIVQNAYFYELWSEVDRRFVDRLSSYKNKIICKLHLFNVSVHSINILEKLISM